METCAPTGSQSSTVPCRPTWPVHPPRLRIAAVVLCVASLVPACAGAPHFEDRWRCLEFSAGPFDLPENDWAPLDARVRGALTFSGRNPEWPCGLEFGVQFARAESKDDQVASSADFVDFRLGPALEWRPSDWLRVACGAGPRFGWARVNRPGTFNEVTENGASVGAYVHAGAFARVHGNFSIGVEAQWADGTDYDVLGGGHDATTSELLLALRWDL